MTSSGGTLPPDAKVALVHDWLTGYRGGEKVLEVLCEIFPRAEIFTLIHVPGSSHPTIERLPVHPSWMNRIPGIERRYRYFLPFFPGWADRLDLSGFDLVVSTSHCVAKGARACGDALHVCYSFTPMRYVWDRFDDYFGSVTGPRKRIIEWQAERLRQWDRRTAQRVDHFLADSRFVRDRILEYYSMEEERVEVLFPPVDLAAFPAVEGGREREDRYLVLSALVPYKKIDVAVEACARSGRRLSVAGSGPELSKLQEIIDRHDASDRISLLGYVSDEELPGLMAGHRAFLFPGVEDFGITPLEASASGLPVIALQQGGALDTVVEGLSGRFFQDGSVEGLIAALEDFESRPAAWDPVRMREHAEGFSRESFKDRLAQRLDWAVRRGRMRP